MDPGQSLASSLFLRKEGKAKKICFVENNFLAIRTEGARSVSPVIRTATSYSGQRFRCSEVEGGIEIRKSRVKFWYRIRPLQDTRAWKYDLQIPSMNYEVF